MCVFVCEFVRERERHRERERESVKVCVNGKEVYKQFQNVHFFAAVGYKWIVCFA